MRRRDLLLIGLPVLALAAAALWLMVHFARPAPPDKLVFSAGVPEGSYQVYASRYKDEFARNKINFDIMASNGAVDNLNRLLDPQQNVDAAFVQSGVVNGQATPGLMSLGMAYPEPLWVFYRGKALLDNLDQLKGMRIAIGPEGSGTRILALELLKAHGIDGAPTALSPLSGIAASVALGTGEIDAAFVVGAAQSGAVWSMFYTPGVEVFNFAQAEAYARRFPYLSVLSLPRGAIDFQAGLPKRDIQLVAPKAMLVARDNLHPALIDLLLQAATDVHGTAGLFQKAGQYPTSDGVEIPLSKEAERYYKSGKPFLQRYLPFWAATLIDRLAVAIIPALAILFPLFKAAPYLYSWRIRSRLFRHYGELKLLEIQAQQHPESKTSQQWLEELDRIEQAANRMPTPLAFSDQVYTLREHVHMVRKTLLRKFSSPENNTD
jgi:TRAP transporter TAXI family solute receptor